MLYSLIRFPATNAFYEEPVKIESSLSCFAFLCSPVRSNFFPEENDLQMTKDDNFYSQDRIEKVVHEKLVEFHFEPELPRKTIERDRGNHETS